MNGSIQPPQLSNLHVLSSQQMGWKGILVEQYQAPPNHTCEQIVPALAAHWLCFPSLQPIHLSQKHDRRAHESIVHQGDLVLVPRGQPTYWRARTDDTPLSNLSIYLQPELFTQIAISFELDRERIDLINCFSRSDPHLYHIAMMLLAELQAGGIMGELYVQSLTQVLVIHLLRQYSNLQLPLATGHTLARTRLQMAIDYIHSHLDLDLSMTEIARNVNCSPTYFASWFKQEIGISLHQYVIKQRVERAKRLLETTDLSIFSIASQVGFASQSHLTHHCKRLTGMTPRQIARSARLSF